MHWMEVGHSLPLLNYGTHPVIRARAMGECYTINGEAHILLYEWTRIDGVFRRVVAGEVIRMVPSQEELVAWRTVCGGTVLH